MLHRGKLYIVAKGDQIFGLPDGWGDFETIVTLPVDGSVTQS